MSDKRRDSGEYYPGGRVIARPGTAPQQVVVQWSDVQGKPQIAPLPDRYREDDMKGKINEIASKFATVVLAALIGWTAIADITVQKKRKDQIYNDEQVVVDVTGSGVGVDTNAVEWIANKAVETNAVTVGLSSSVSNRYTKGETDALLSGKQANIGIVDYGVTVVMPEGRSLAVQGDLNVSGGANIQGPLYADYIAVNGEVRAMWHEVFDANAHGELSAYTTSDDDPNAEHMHIRTFADTNRGLPYGDIVVPRKIGVMALTSDIPAPYVPDHTDPTFSNAVLAVTTNTIRSEVSAALNTYVDGETGVEYVGKFHGGSLYYVPTGNVYPPNN